MSIMTVRFSYIYVILLYGYRCTHIGLLVGVINTQKINDTTYYLEVTVSGPGLIDNTCHANTYAYLGSTPGPKPILVSYFASPLARQAVYDIVYDILSLSLHLFALLIAPLENVYPSQSYHILVGFGEGFTIGPCSPHAVPANKKHEDIVGNTQRQAPGPTIVP